LASHRFLRSSHLFASAVLAIGALLSGCGGGSGGSQKPPQTDVPLNVACPDDEFVPNEMQYTSHLYRLTKLPAIVYFVRDAYFTAARRKSALAGFSQWTEATGGKVSFIETDNPQYANVTVRFTDQLAPTVWGATTLDFYVYDRVLNGGQISITVGREETPARLQATAAHEFGHVLGMNVHTPDCEDVMAKTFYCGFPTTPMPLSVRDVNTIKTAYCWMFSPP
jgi:hypothetical protein